MRLLSEKGLLLKLFTQNIDCLERLAGIPDKEIIEAHGSFARHRCIECKSPYPEDLMKEAIRRREVPYCTTPQCNGLVKPDIVFFGEQLPEEFHANRNLPSQADLCIIIGTSLQVHPFASLPGFCSDGVPRLLINSEQVGALGSRADDVLLLGDCDSGIRRLASSLGWTKELEALWDKTKPSESQKKSEELETKSRDEALEDEIAILTKEVDLSLKIADDHDVRVRKHLREEAAIDSTATSELHQTPIPTETHESNPDKSPKSASENVSASSSDEDPNTPTTVTS